MADLGEELASAGFDFGAALRELTTEGKLTQQDADRLAEIACRVTECCLQAVRHGLEREARQKQLLDELTKRVEQVAAEAKARPVFVQPSKGRVFH